MAISPLDRVLRLFDYLDGRSDSATQVEIKRELDDPDSVESMALTMIDSTAELFNSHVMSSVSAKALHYWLSVTDEEREQLRSLLPEELQFSETNWRHRQILRSYPIEDNGVA